MNVRIHQRTTADTNTTECPNFVGKGGLHGPGQTDPRCPKKLLQVLGVIGEVFVLPTSTLFQNQHTMAFLAKAQCTAGSTKTGTHNDLIEIKAFSNFLTCTIARWCCVYDNDANESVTAEIGDRR